MKLVKYAVVFLVGIAIGTFGSVLIKGLEYWSAIHYGQSVGYLKIIELIANKKLIAGPLVITEPNYTFSDCFFLTLKRADDPEGALIVSDSAVNGYIVNNHFSSHNFSVIAPGKSTLVDNTWVSNFIADIGSRNEY